MDRVYLKEFVREYDENMCWWRKVAKHRCHGIRRLNEIVHRDIAANPRSFPDLADEIVKEFKLRLERHAKNGRSYTEENSRDVNVLFQAIAMVLASEVRFDPEKPVEQVQRRLLFFTLTCQIRNEKLLDGKTDIFTLPSNEVFLTTTGEAYHLKKELFPMIEKNELTNVHGNEPFSEEDAADIGTLYLHYKKSLTRTFVGKESTVTPSPSASDSLGPYATLKVALDYQRKLVDQQIIDAELAQRRLEQSSYSSIGM